LKGLVYIETRQKRKEYRSPRRERGRDSRSKISDQAKEMKGDKERGKTRKKKEKKQRQS
jgi:hypothetical protein